MIILNLDNIPIGSFDVSFSSTEIPSVTYTFSSEGLVTLDSDVGHNWNSNAVISKRSLPLTFDEDFPYLISSAANAETFETIRVDANGDIVVRHYVTTHLCDGTGSLLTETAESNGGFVSNLESYRLLFLASESTDDFDESDVICEGGVLSDFSGSGKTYTGTFTPTGEDVEVAVSVNAGSFHDVAGNGNMDADDNSEDNWVLVFRHDSRLGMFSNDNDWAEAKRTNPDNTHPDDGKFSILDEIETLGKQSDGTYVTLTHIRKKSITHNTIFR